MDNVIGTNEIGAVLGMASDELQAFQDAAAYEAALAQQILLGAAIGAATPPKGTAKTPPAKTPPKGPVNKGLSVLSTPSGGKATPSGGKALSSKVSQIHQQAFSRGLQNVQGAADHAKKVGTKTIAVAAAYNLDSHKPLAVITHHGVHGILGVIHDPVLGVTHAGLTPKQHAAVAAHNSAIARTHASATDAIKAGNRAVAAGKAAGVTAKKVKPIFDKTTGKTGGGVHGILGWDFPVIGVDANGLTAGQQGYDPTTDPDSPQYAGGDQGAGGQGGFTPDPTLYTPERWGLPSIQPLLTGLDGDNPDPNLTQVPSDNPYTDVNGANPAPGLKKILTGGGTLSKADAMVPVQGPAPADAVKWTGPIPDGGAASANVDYGGGDGYFYGSSATGVAAGVYHDDLGWYIKRGSGWDQTRHGHGISFAQANQESIMDGYGPIVGRGQLKNAQYSPSGNAEGNGDVFFWTSANAPTQYLAQQNAAIADANDKVLKDANDAVNKANQALRDANDATLKADNAAIAAGNANTTQLMNQMAEALLKQKAANELQQTTDTGAEQHAASQQGIDTKAAQAKIDQETQQQQLDESTRASQLEADMTRAQQAQDAQEAQFEHQYALADQQVQAQLAPIQAQSDAQMQQALLQMLMQPPQPQGFDPSQMQGFDPSQMQGFDPSQMQGFDPSQMQGFDPSQMQGFDPSQVIDPSQMQGFDSSQVIDPTQIPGYFDASMYYGG